MKIKQMHCSQFRVSVHSYSLFKKYNLKHIPPWKHIFVFRVFWQSNTQFLWTKYLRNTKRKFLHNCHLEISDELIRFWWQLVTWSALVGWGRQNPVPALICSVWQLSNHIIPDGNNKVWIINIIGHTLYTQLQLSVCFDKDKLCPWRSKRAF